MKILIPIIGLIIIAIVVVPQVLFTVDETESAIVTRFGEVQNVYTEPGLKIKAPFVDSVNKQEKRLLRVDIPVATLPDQEAQFLDIDAYVRYRITDPFQYFIRLRTELNAGQRVVDIVVSALRAQIGQHTREEIIGGRITIQEDGLPSVNPLLMEDGVPSRAAITRNVLEAASRSAQNEQWGIEIMDVRIMRADFPEGEIQNAVFQRMRTEREIQAQRLRATGEEEYLTRTADVDRQVEIIRAEAQEERDRLRGEGQAEAIRILADALEQDPELYSFLRSLEAYEETLDDNATLLLSPDSPLFQFLQGPNGMGEVLPPPAGEGATP
ncbi:MAG: protease modulator HflC [Dehalococcoidia bacterium]